MLKNKTLNPLVLSSWGELLTAVQVEAWTRYFLNASNHDAEVELNFDRWLLLLLLLLLRWWWRW